MLVTFDKEYLKELYVSGKCSDKKHRFQPDVIKRYKRCIDTLIASKNAESLYKHNSLNYEILVGDKCSFFNTGNFKIPHRVYCESCSRC